MSSQESPDLLEILSHWIMRTVTTLFLGFVQRPLQIVLFILVGSACGFGFAAFEGDKSSSMAIIQVEKVNVRTMMSALNDLNILIDDHNFVELASQLNLDEKQARLLSKVSTRPLLNYPAEGGTVNKLPIEVQVEVTSPEVLIKLDSAMLFFFKEFSGLSNAAERQLQALEKREKALKGFLSDTLQEKEPYDELQAELKLINTQRSLKRLTDSVTILKGFVPRNRLDHKPFLTYALIGAIAGWLLFGIFTKSLKRN